MKKQSKRIPLSKRRKVVRQKSRILKCLSHWRSKIPLNKTDPITLNEIKRQDVALFYHIYEENEKVYVYAFEPESLCQWIMYEKKFYNPITKKQFLKPEIMRLNRCCKELNIVQLYNQLLSEDGEKILKSIHDTQSMQFYLENDIKFLIDGALMYLYNLYLLGEESNPNVFHYIDVIFLSVIVYRFHTLCSYVGFDTMKDSHASIYKHFETLLYKTEISKKDIYLQNTSVYVLQFLHVLDVIPDLISKILENKVNQWPYIHKLLYYAQNPEHDTYYIIEGLKRLYCHQYNEEDEHYIETPTLLFDEVISTDTSIEESSF